MVENSESTFLDDFLKGGEREKIIDQWTSVFYSRSNPITKKNNEPDNKKIGKTNQIPCYYFEGGEEERNTGEQ